MSALVRQCTPSGSPIYGKNKASFARGDDATKALLEYRLRLQAGTWALDITAGIDWIGLMGRGYSTQKIESEIKRVTLQTPGILSIADYSFQKIGRTAIISLTVITDGGSVVSLEVTR
jgi:hypothetical protein